MKIHDVMKYGLIGCGRISKNHIIAAKKNELNIVAICDVVYEKMVDCKARFGLSDDVTYYTDYRDMLKKEKIDLIAIATESGKHASIALDCLNAECNVIIEKPMALSIEDTDKIISLAKIQKLKVQVVHQNRFNKAIRKVREAFENGEFGRIMYGTANIRWSRNEAYYKSSSWRGTWEQDGGALMNQCIHDIDLLAWMLGGNIVEVYGVTARRKHPYIEAEDFGTAIIRTSNGNYGIIEGTTNIYPQNYEETLSLFAEKGLVKIGGKAVNCIIDWISDSNNNSAELKKKNSEEPLNIYGNGHVALYEDMINAIVNDVEPQINAAEGKRAVEIILAIYKSAVNKKIIQLPLQKGATVDYKGIYKNI